MAGTNCGRERRPPVRGKRDGGVPVLSLGERSISVESVAAFDSVLFGRDRGVEMYDQGRPVVLWRLPVTLAAPFYRGPLHLLPRELGFNKYVKGLIRK